MNEQVFSQKYELYKVMVFRVCYSYLSNIHDSEDAVQEVFLRLFQKNKVFPDADQEKYFLIRMAINASKDLIRKRKSVSIDCDTQAAPKETNDLTDILVLVEKLKPKYRDIIILKFLKDLDSREISTILRISESAVRKRQQRAIEMLQEMAGERKNEKPRRKNTKY